MRESSGARAQRTVWMERPAVGLADAAAPASTAVLTTPAAAQRDTPAAALTAADPALSARAVTALLERTDSLYQGRF